MSSCTLYFFTIHLFFYFSFRCDLVREQDVLTHREEYLDQRQDELNKRAEVLNQTEKLLKESETRHRRLQDEQSKQFTELQEKNHKLHEMEKQLVLVGLCCFFVVEEVS